MNLLLTKPRILETHHKSPVVAGAFILTVGGWFMWLSCLSQTFEPLYDEYFVAGTFVHNFGHTLLWWTFVLLGLTCLLVLELAVQAVRRVYLPTDVDIMQRIEKRQHARGATVADLSDEAEAGLSARSDVSPSPYPESVAEMADEAERVKSNTSQGQALQQQATQQTQNTSTLQVPQAMHG